jgi:hypothetical protein
VTTRETDESWRKGRGAQPFDEAIEATLTADGDQTILVIEVRGMPLDKIAFYGAGWQIHAENLAAHLAGRERGDTEARWDELVPRIRTWRPTSARHWPLPECKLLLSAANTAAKPLDTACPVRTTLERRPST